MRNYEPFNQGAAMRLTSITCDRCGAELYRAPGQPVGSIGYGTFYPATKHDLCPECLAGAKRLVESYIKGAP